MAARKAWTGRSGLFHMCLFGDCAERRVAKEEGTERGGEDPGTCEGSDLDLWAA